MEDGKLKMRFNKKRLICNGVHVVVVVVVIKTSTRISFSFLFLSHSLHILCVSLYVSLLVLSLCLFYILVFF